jgi:hypothetical protein
MWNLWDNKVVHSEPIEFQGIKKIYETFSNEGSKFQLIWTNSTAEMLKINHVTLRTFSLTLCCVAQIWLPVGVSYTQMHDHLWLAVSTSSTKNVFHLSKNNSSAAFLYMFSFTQRSSSWHGMGYMIPLIMSPSMITYAFCHTDFMNCFNSNITL